MRNKFASMIGVLAGLTMLVVSGAAMAADPVTLKIEPGVAVPLITPQTDRFDAGGSLTVKPLVGLTSYLDIGPTFSVLALPSSVPGVDAGTVWGLGGGLRVKRPHDASNTGTGFKAVSPWVDADLQYVRTGDLGRGAVSVAAGASVPTSNARTLWVGPFVRYQDVLEGNRIGFDSTDAHVLILGVSLEIGPKAKVADTAPVQPVVESDRDHDGAPDSSDRCPDVPGPKDNFGCPVIKKEEVTTPPVDKVQYEFTADQMVHFAFDSSILRPTENKQLAEVTAALLKNVNYKVRLEGHASSEGKVEYNQKLSERRANAVLEYLVKQGVSRDRLTSVGFGASKPVADNKTEAGRVANRRVEFAVTLVIVNDGEVK